MLTKCVSLVFLIISLGYFHPLKAQNACPSCVLGYPYTSNNPRTAQIFSESTVLIDYDPTSICGNVPQYIRLWYSDEHAVLLGVRQVVVDGVATNYPVTPTPAKPTCVDRPAVGTQIPSGNQSGNDIAVDGGRPIWPVLYLTDITNDPSSRSGDWQQHTQANPATGYAPSRICGTWKAAVRYVKNGVVTVVPDADPAANGSDLGGGEAPPNHAAFGKYGAEIEWKLSDLPLLSGHRYRIQFMVHDGDQNKTGGDAGEACTSFTAPTQPSSIGDFVFDDNGGPNNDITLQHNGIQDAGEPGVPNITVTLYDKNGNVKATTFTDASGHYIFNNVDVSAGCTQYKLGFSPLPNNYQWTKKGAGTDTTLDSNAPNKDQAVPGYTDLFTICPGQSRLDIDAGMYNIGGLTPVRITQFSGKYDNGISVLNWTISSQEGISSYNVERSIDGINFSGIGNVKVNNTAGNNRYVYNDKIPSAGMNYYRLKNIETSGYYTFSNAIAINAPVKGISVRSVYPNPFLSQLKVAVSSENAEPVTIRVIDNSGRVLKVLNVTTQKGNNEYLVNDLSSLKGGLYIVEVKTPFTTIHSKVSK